MCCWFTPQFNFTEILRQSELDGLREPDWGHWFMKIEKASSRYLGRVISTFVSLNVILKYYAITGGKNGKG